MLTIPPSDSELIDRICCAIADALDCSADEIGLDDDLYQTLGLDSLGMVALFTDLSYQFGIPEIQAESDVAGLSNARLIADYVRSFEVSRSADEPT